MNNRVQKNVYIKHTRRRRQFDINQGLGILCLAILVNLAEPSESYKEVLPYPLASINVNSSKEIKVNVSKGSEDKTKYCFKPECIHTASRVLKYIDTSFEPCDDFYKFACGQYPGITVKSDNELYVYNNFVAIDEKIKQQVKNVLEKESESTDPRYVKLMKTLYQSCMNTTNSKNQTLQSFSDLLKKIGGWPILEGNSWKDDSFKWEKFASKIKNITSLDTDFFYLDIYNDPKSSSNMVLYITQPSFPLVSSNDFIDLISSVLTDFGVDKDNVLIEIDQIFVVRRALFDISVSEGDRQFNDFKRMTVRDLEGNYSNILWKERFNVLLEPLTEVKDDDVVIVWDSSFFEKFNNLIDKIPKREQANYLVWNAFNRIYKNFGYIKNDTNQWKECYKNVEKAFQNNFGALYTKNYFPLKSDNKHIVDMLKNIFQQFKINIQKLQCDVKSQNIEADWLDQKTKNNALEKLASMSVDPHTIYKLLDDKEIDKFYSNLEITPGNAIQSFLNASKFYKSIVATLFNKSVDKTNWMFRSSQEEVQAKYHLFVNRIGISSGILQGVFFNENRPHYMNYGSIGMIVGHEITHAFDSKNRKYDKEGNFVNWWQPESNAQFLSKAQCIIYQYGNYTAQEIGLNVNGTITQGENIADNAGLKTAYLAYEKWVERNGIEPLLPGVNYTQSQLFWISFAQAFCDKKTPNALRNIIQHNLHSPSEFRILGSLANRPEFARDFNCPVGKRMNPKEKCSVW